MKPPGQGGFFALGYHNEHVIRQQKGALCICKAKFPGNVIIFKLQDINTMPDLFEQGNEIARKIELYHRKWERNYQQNDTDSPQKWNKTEFIAEILLHSTEEKYYAPSRESIEKLRKKFFNKTKITINLDSLFDKGWLRKVTNVILMPTAIRAGVSSAEKIRNCKNEIVFLKSISNANVEKIDRVKLRRLMNQYEQLHKVSLNIDNAQKAHLVSEIEDSYQINNINYYDPVLHNWDDFHFLSFLLANVYQKNNGLIISKNTLNDIYFRHKTNYLFTPTLKEIVDSSFLVRNPRFYEVNLNKLSENSLNQAGAIFWNKLSFMPNSNNKLLFWSKRMLYKVGHQCEINVYFNNHEIHEFADAAITLINNENDLEDGECEYQKVLMDFHHDHSFHSTIWRKNRYSNLFPKNVQDAFDVLNAIIGLNNVHQDYLMFHQSCRWMITYLIREVIKACDTTSRDNSFIYNILKHAHAKPYILWTVCQCIWEWKPGLIPVLIKNSSFSSLGLLILQKMQISTAAAPYINKVRLNIIADCFEYVLKSTYNNQQITNERKAKIIFDCLSTYISNQFIIKGQLPAQQKIALEEAISVANKIKNIFSESTHYREHYYNFEGVHQLYFPKLLHYLFKCVNTHHEPNYIRNSTMDFDYGKLDILIYLFKLAQSKSYQSLYSNEKTSNYEFAEALLNCYLETMTATRALSMDFETGEPTQSIPLFLPAQQNIETIDWAFIFLRLEEQTLSKKFLSPLNMEFRKVDNRYDEYNRFIAGKVRIHLKILIKIFNKIYLNQADLKLKGLGAKTILAKLENTITEIVIYHSFDEFSKCRMDIFNERFERTYWGGNDDELLPGIGQILNRFEKENKEKIINGLVRSEQFIRALKLLSFVTSEKDRQVLVDIIFKEDINKVLEKLTALHDFQFLLVQLAAYVEFIDKANNVLEYWEKNIAPRKRKIWPSDIEILTYRTKLLLAFQSGNLDEILEVRVPQTKPLYFDHGKLFDPETERDFYRALFYHNHENPKEAYIINNRLLNNKNDDRTTIALNRFASKIKWAENTDDIHEKHTLLMESIEEWNTFENSLSRDVSLENIKEHIWHNKLQAFDTLKKHEQFDALYNELDLPIKLKQSFLELGIKNLMSRQMKNQAVDLWKQASVFHELKDGSIPDFVMDANNLLVKQDDIESLKASYRSLMSATPSLLVQIIPDNINNGSDVNGFILNEIIGAASDMLTFINSVVKVSHEDKYSDLLGLSLNARIRHYGWHIGNARGGYSDSDKINPGLIDFAIYSANKERIAICEAMNIAGKNTSEVKKHSIKVFNYDPAKKLLIVLVYYRGKETGFETSWKKYKANITNDIEFPESFLLVDGSFTDNSLESNINAIKIGKSTHGINICLHHVFININYRSNPVNSKSANPAQKAKKKL